MRILLSSALATAMTWTGLVAGTPSVFQGSSARHHLRAPERHAAGQSTPTCDRACLNGLLDGYVDALVARDPSRLPPAGARTFTENGQRLDLGDGLWHTVTGKGRYALRLADPDRGQAVLMG